MNWSRNRIIVACLLTAALGLMLCPPWHGRGHRLLWNGRGSLDWSRLALELCLVAVIGALAAVVASTVGGPSARAPKVWFRRAGVVLGGAAVTILVLTAGYDAIVRFTLLHHYKKKVQEFQAKGPLLQEAFPLVLAPIAVTNEIDFRLYNFRLYNPITNVHEAEIMLRSLGCDDRAIQRAVALFLSASAPDYNEKTLTFGLGVSDGKNEDCLPQDIFDKVTAEARAAGKTGPAPQRASPKVKWDDKAAPQWPPGFTERLIAFDFRIEDTDAAKRFFAPLPGWYAEALQHNIEVSRVPYWMKPGEPPVPWSFTDWLGLRSPWLVLAVGMLASSLLCFVVAGRIDQTVADAQGSAHAARVSD